MTFTTEQFLKQCRGYPRRRLNAKADLAASSKRGVTLIPYWQRSPIQVNPLVVWPRSAPHSPSLPFPIRLIPSHYARHMSLCHLHKLFPSLHHSPSTLSIRNVTYQYTALRTSINPSALPHPHSDNSPFQVYVFRKEVHSRCVEILSLHTQIV